MRRRTSVRVIRLVVLLAVACAGFEPFGQARAASLERDFQNPPPEVGLSVVYHWSGGVAHDLDATGKLIGKKFLEDVVAAHETAEDDHPSLGRVGRW